MSRWRSVKAKQLLAALLSLLPGMVLGAWIVRHPYSDTVAAMLLYACLPVLHNWYTLPAFLEHHVTGLARGTLHLLALLLLGVVLIRRLIPRYRRDRERRPETPASEAAVTAAACLALLLVPPGWMW